MIVLFQTGCHAILLSKPLFSDFWALVTCNQNQVFITPPATSTLVAIASKRPLGKNVTKLIHYKHETDVCIQYLVFL